MPELLDFTRMTGDLRQGHARLPATHRGGRRRRLRGRRRHDCAGRRYAAGHRRARARPSCSPAWAWPARDMGACTLLPRTIGQGRASRTAVHRPRDDRAGRRGTGASSTPCTSPKHCCRPRSELAGQLAAGPTFAHGVHQEAAAPGMEYGRGRGHRGRGRRRRPSACRPATSVAPTRPSWTKRKPVLRGELNHGTMPRLAGLAVLRRRASRAGRASWMPGARKALPRSRPRTTPTPPAATLVRRGWAQAGWLRYCRARRAGRQLGRRPARRWIRAPCASCAKRWRATTAWPTSPSPCRAWAAAPSALGGSDALAGAATCRAWRAARPSPPSRCPKPRPGSDVAAMACEARRDGGHYVLNGAKTWISNGGIADFYCVFARTGEAPGRARHQRLRGRRRHAGPVGRRAHRGHRPASRWRPAALRGLPHPRRPAPGRARARVSSWP